MTIVDLGDGLVKHIVIGTAGHIDHGKSSLVKALTGVDPDRLKEEKARGITIDLGFARYSYESTEFSFVDVPGHERFVRNMLAGVSGIDGVLLVIAADESVMPQTREHLDICRLLDVQTGIVALTKVDLVDTDTLELVRLETRELLQGTFLEEAMVVPVSSRSGKGLSSLRDELSNLADTISARNDDGVARVPIDRAFTLKGFGTVITGTQVSGRITQNTELSLMPSARKVKVRNIQVHGLNETSSTAGQRVAINLAGVEVGELRRGDTLTSPHGLVTSAKIDGTVKMLAGAKALKHGSRVRFHQGTTEVMARVSLGAECIQEYDGAQEPVFPAMLEPGVSVFIRLHLERLVAVARGDKFVLRTYSPPVTIAGGVVLDPRMSKTRLRSKTGCVRLRRLQASDTDAMEAMIEETAGMGLRIADLVPRIGLSKEQTIANVEQLERGNAIVRVGEKVISSNMVEPVVDTLRRIVTVYHKEKPLKAGIPREEARERVSRIAGDELFGYVLEVLVDSGELQAGRHIALTAHRIELSSAEAVLKERLAKLFVDGGLTPPDVGRWAIEAGETKDAVDRMLTMLIEEGTLERVGSLVFGRGALSRLKIEVRELKRAGEEEVRIEISEFKARFEITRKYAIPLLEYLDHSRVTRRVGKERFVV